jgi:cell volume regulation protein A
MITAVNLAILIGAGLIVTSAFTSVLSQRVGAPLLLVFLAIGLLAGEDGILGIEFDNAPIAYFIGSLALAIILFDSGFATPFQRYRQAAAPALVLATAGVALTAGLIGGAAYLLLDLKWVEALMLGAIIASTDAAAVFFLLKVGSITVRDRVSSTLEIESGTNDPMAIFLTMMLVTLAAAGDTASEQLGWHVAWTFVREITLGGVLGWAGGLAIAWLLNRLRTLDPSLFPIVSLCLALVVFSATGMLGGSGFLAAYVAGLVAGNRRVRHVAQIRRFQVGMTWLAQIGMFLTLGLLATPSQFGGVALPAIVLAALLIFVARPVTVAICLIPFRFSFHEIAFVSWVGLRGAVSILLAILPTLGGVPNGGLYFNVIFIMVLASLLLQGWTIRPAARWLRMIVPTRTGLVERLELELPGMADQELIGYRIHAESRIARGERVPRWARPLLVVRDDRSYTIHNAGPLSANDHVYLFAPPKHIELLDRLYGPPSPTGDEVLLGDFRLSATASLAEIANQYGFECPLGTEAIGIGKYLEDRLNSPPEVGDRIPLGPVELVVRGIDDMGSINEVGLSLEPAPSPRTRLRHLFTRFLIWRRGQANVDE